MQSTPKLYTSYNIGILIFNNFKNEIYIYVQFLPPSPLLPAVFQSAGVRPGARVGRHVAQPVLFY